MSKLYVEDGGNKVQVVELGLLTGKQQVILGNVERDLILRTSGNIQIQVGNKFYPLKYSTDTNTSTTVISSSTTILTKYSDLSSLLYPGEGHFVFIKENKSFYITSDSSYIKLNGTTDVTGNPDTKLYVSYSSEQTLTGPQKLLAHTNIGEVINSFSDISGYTINDVYSNQIFYNILDKKHYVLSDVNNPAIQESYKEVYLNLTDGGVVHAPVSIDLFTNAKSLSSLHIQGKNNSTNAKLTTVASSMLTVGESDYSSGIAIWSNGSSYLQNLEAGNTKGFVFVTISGDNNLCTPLTIYSKNIGILGPIDNKYSVTINGTSKFTGLSVLNKGITTDTYSSNVSGYTLTQDPNDNKWLLEVDKLIVRDAITNGSVTQSKSNGEKWSNPSIKVRTATILDDINVYALASKIGNYKDVSSVKVLISLSEKLDYALCDQPIDITTPGSARVVSSMQLPYGVGDRDSGGTLLSYNTYIKDLTSTYVSVVPTHSYDGTKFTPDSGGTYVNTQSINITFVETDNVNLPQVGDVLYYATYKPDGSEDRLVIAKVISISSEGLIIHVYNGERIDVGIELAIVGRTIDNDAIHFKGGEGSNYIEHLSNVNSFRQLFSNFYLNLEGYESFPINNYKPLTSKTITKLGWLNNLVDSNYGLDGTQGIGLYSTNAFLKGNFILNDATFNSVPTVLTYNPFVMLTSGGKLQQIDMTAKIAYWNAKADNTISITATGSGLIGGGNLTANRTLALDFTYIDSIYAKLLSPTFSGNVTVPTLGTSVSSVYAVNSTWVNNYFQYLSNLDTDGTLSSPSTTKYPSTSAVKTYVDTAISSGTITTIVSQVTVGGQTANNTLITYNHAGAGYNTYRVNTMIVLRSYTSGNIYMTCTYTDQVNNTYTITFPTISSMTNSQYAPVTISAKNGTNILVDLVITGTCLVDATGVIELLD